MSAPVSEGVVVCLGVRGVWMWLGGSQRPSVLHPTPGTGSESAADLTPCVAWAFRFPGWLWSFPAGCGNGSGVYAGNRLGWDGRGNEVAVGERLAAWGSWKAGSHRLEAQFQDLVDGFRAHWLRCCDGVLRWSPIS